MSEQSIDRAADTLSSESGRGTARAVYECGEWAGVATVRVLEPGVSEVAAAGERGERAEAAVVLVSGYGVDDVAASRGRTRDAAASVRVPASSVGEVAA